MQTFAVGDIWTNLTEIVSSGFAILTGNPMLLAISCSAVGIPIVGGLLSLIGRRG